jgi:hypothetical protein
LWEEKLTMDTNIQQGHNKVYMGGNSIRIIYLLYDTHREDMKQLRECISTVQETYVNIQQLDFVVELEWMKFMVTIPKSPRYLTLKPNRNFLRAHRFWYGNGRIGLHTMTFFKRKNYRLYQSWALCLRESKEKRQKVDSG